MDKSFPHRFLDKTEYYVSVMGEKPVFMKTKKSDVLAVFTDEDRDAIKQYIKEKRTDFGDSRDLLNLFTFANTLRTDGMESK